MPNVPSIVLRVDDVGRISGDTPENGTDGDLDYFFKWREVAGLKGFPVVYGVVPTWLTPKGYRRLKHEIRIIEKIALHGWDHKAATEVAWDQMRVGAMLLNTDIYIPPYNKYDYQTLSGWMSTGGRFFLGGFFGSDHDCGERPSIVHREGRSIIHLSACRLLYGHVGDLCSQMKLGSLPTDYPIVATLHVPWDKPEEVKEFVDAVGPYLIPIQQIIDYLAEPPTGRWAREDKKWQ